MADGSNRPAQGAPDMSPSTPPPLGALSLLPEVLLAHLCSFLSGRDLARLGGACAALHESPVSLWPRLKVGLRDEWWSTEGEDDEAGRQRRVEALRMLARRASGALKELQLEYEEVLEAFFSAVRAGGRPLAMLTSLHVEVDGYDEGARGKPDLMMIVDPLAKMLAAGQLPMLQELYLSTREVKSMLPVWRAVGEGACPRLERIEIDECSSQQLSELAEAMRAKPEGCEGLRAVCLTLDEEDEKHATCEALQALLSRLSPRSLEELSLQPVPSDSLPAAIVPALGSEWTALKTLQLSVMGLFSSDGLLHALAQGAMPSLSNLDVSGGSCSDEAWRVLGEAMGPEGTCLRRIKTLGLGGVIGDPRQVEILCRALGTGHGCPELEVIKINTERGHGGEPWGAALALAFRPSHGLPRLKKLCLHYMDLTDLDQLVEALQHRPHASQPMEVISIWQCKFEGATALGRAMAEGGVLAGLKQLSMSSYGGGGEEWPMQLAEALAGGAGQQLEDIEWKSEELSVDVVNRLLQGLAIRGACPRLRRLMLGRMFSAQGGLLDACSLGTILAGRAACSHTLRELQFGLFSPSSEGLRTVAACLREPQAIQLESIQLWPGEPDACEAVMELLSALGGRAGDRLRNLFMSLSRCEEGEAMRMAEHVVGIIKAGGLPVVKENGIKIHVPGRFSRADVQKALEDRAKAQWLASW